MNDAELKRAHLVGDGECPFVPGQALFMYKMCDGPSLEHTNLCAIFSVDGKYPVDLIKHSIVEVINANSALLLTLSGCGVAATIGGRRRCDEMIIPVIDYRMMSPQEARQRAKVTASELTWQAFPSIGGALVRAFIILLPEETVVGLVSHHLFTDMLSQRSLKWQRCCQSNANQSPPGALRS